MCDIPQKIPKISLLFGDMDLTTNRVAKIVEPTKKQIGKSSKRTQMTNIATQMVISD